MGKINTCSDSLVGGDDALTNNTQIKNEFGFFRAVRDPAGDTIYECLNEQDDVETRGNSQSLQEVLFRRRRDMSNQNLCSRTFFSIFLEW